METQSAIPEIDLPSLGAIMEAAERDTTNRMPYGLDFASCIRLKGFAVIGAVFSRAQITSLASNLTAWIQENHGDERFNHAGIRISLASCPPARTAALDPTLLNFVSAILGKGARPVRAILFDKTPDANWSVGWHQDLTIGVAENLPVPGFSVWSRKDGIPHVQPPAEILEQMLTARIHFDDCGEANGPLRVHAGSHRSGRLSPQHIAAWRAKGRETMCTADAGDILFMRPLLLHASSSSTVPAHRRVLHLEYAACSLPGGLRWNEDPQHPVYSKLVS